MLSSLLVLAVIALLLPAIFNLAQRAVGQHRLAITDEQLSIGVSLVLLALYAANLAYTLVTHRDMFASSDPHESRGHTGWPLWLAAAVLVGATAVIALEAELVSGALDATAGSFGLSTIFLGVIVLTIVGTASGLFAATWFAWQDRMGLLLAICISSAIHMALVVAPVPFLLLWAIGRPMKLGFDNPLDLFAIAGAAFLVNAIAADGETRWFEGVLLIGVYALFGLPIFLIR